MIIFKVDGGMAWSTRLVRNSMKWHVIALLATSAVHEPMPC